MSDFFAKAGRVLGQKSAPWLRKYKWYWHDLTSDQAAAIRAETEFGAVLAQEFKARYGEADDPQDKALVVDIGQRLSRCVRNQLWKFRVEVVRNDEPTATAIPGGFIFLANGLLTFCHRQPDELAFVIGHEMAHVIRKHAMKRIARNVSVEMISAVLTRGALNPWLRRAGTKLLQSAYSQDTELEADRLGSRMAKMAGYDPQGAVRFFQRIEALRGRPEGLGEYFSSHPSETVRQAELDAYWNTKDHDQ